MADVEIELKDMEDREAGVDSSENDCKRYLLKACNTLVPLLLELLTKQSEDQDEDDNEWSVSNSASHPSSPRFYHYLFHFVFLFHVYIFLPLISPHPLVHIPSS